MTDNRTNELREKLNKLVIELDRLDITLDSPASDMTLGEYEQEREKLLDGFIQAISATLGSEREKELEELVRDMWREITTCPDYRMPPCMTRNICDRIRELEIGVDDDDRSINERMVKLGVVDEC